MDFEPTAVNVAVIRWYALKIEMLAIQAMLTKKHGELSEFNVNRARTILRQAVADLEGLRVLDGTIDCDPPLVPCQGFCVDDCPDPSGQ